ncbi:MAG: AIR synthase [Candidatus Latescibacterota bacterium]|jgi:hydrogenase maturation factor|nr:MAG: AIR synthase [Candidatus Latescibacterota bacterium]
MNPDKLPALGKIHPEFFDRVIYPRLGASGADIVIGPRHGVDYGVFRAGDTMIALSTDPFFIVPAFGFAKAAWFAFHIVFCDVAVSGLRPRYLAIDLNLPPEMTEEDIEEMWIAVHDEASKYGVSVVTGHTARYTGCNYPMVGGATAIAVGPESELRGPHLVRTGDKVVITKGPAVEATGLLAVLFKERFVEAGGPAFQREAETMFYQMSVLDDCAIARRFEGVRAMHDATECGIWGGLHEMATAGGYGLRIERDSIPVAPAARRTAELFGFDPYCAISEGTLIAVVAAHEAEGLVRALGDAGIEGAVCGEIVPRDRGLTVTSGGTPAILEHPKVDPYWAIAARLST